MTIYKYTVGLTWSGEGGPGVNVWHMRGEEDTGPGDDPQALVENIGDFYEAISAMYPPSVTITGPPEIVRDPYGSPTFKGITGFSVSGTAAHDTYAPLATQLVLGWRTTAATRRGRGRTFLGPVAADVMQADGTPADVWVTALREAGQDLIDTFDGIDNGAIGVYSQVDNVLRDFVSCSVRDQFAVLRSRRD